MGADRVCHRARERVDDFFSLVVGSQESGQSTEHREPVARNPRDARSGRVAEVGSRVDSRSAWRRWVPRVGADDALRLCGVATPKRGLGASLAALILLSLVYSGSASATGIGFPDDPVLSDPCLTRLELGTEYIFTPSQPQVDVGWTNSKGETLTFNLEVSFLGEDQEFVPGEFMIVFTSIRRGNQASVTCGDLSPGGALPFAPYAFVDDSASGAVVRQLAATDSPIFGEGG